MQVRRVERGRPALDLGGADRGVRVDETRARGRVHEDASLLDGFVVESDGRPVGCALWHEVDGDAELAVIVTTYRGAGAGTLLLDAVVEYARAHGWKRLWLITTNDNTDALRLYQRAGWDWVAWHRDGVTKRAR